MKSKQAAKAPKSKTYPTLPLGLVLLTNILRENDRYANEALARRLQDAGPQILAAQETGEDRTVVLARLTDRYFPDGTCDAASKESSHISIVSFYAVVSAAWYVLTALQGGKR